MSIEKSVKIIQDKIIPNTVEIEITGETHTLGNLITEMLLEDERCTFAAYKVPHPLVEKVLIKVSSVQKSEATTLVLDVLKKLNDDICELLNQFEKQEKDSSHQFIQN